MVNVGVLSARCESKAEARRRDASAPKRFMGSLDVFFDAHWDHESRQRSADSLVREFPPTVYRGLNGTSSELRFMGRIKVRAGIAIRSRDANFMELSLDVDGKVCHVKADLYRYQHGRGT